MNRKANKITTGLISVLIMVQGSAFGSFTRQYSNNDKQKIFMHDEDHKIDSIIYPEVGKPCPDFILTNISYFSKKQASLKDFKGKWLVLDFWNKDCGACIASFPKTSALQSKFGDQVQFMLVGFQDKENEIESMYDKFREKEKLIMPCAFDSALCNRFDIYTAPHIIILDKNGIVRGITSRIDSNDINSFLSGSTPQLPKTYRFMHDTSNTDGKFAYDPDKNFLINNNGGSDTDFLFRSIITKWNPELQVQSAPSSIDKYALGAGRFQALGVPLSWLYNYAFWGQINWGAKELEKYGKIFDKPILETGDSSFFNYSFRNGRNLFCYSLKMTAQISTKEMFKREMQHELTTYFGFTAKVERRNCPYWKLEMTKAARKRLKSKGGPKFFSGIPKANFTARNWPFSNLLSLIRGYNSGIFIDKTNYKENIDITMNCLLTDLTDIQKELLKNGLKLVPAKKKMLALVIKGKANFKGD